MAFGQIRQLFISIKAVDGATGTLRRVDAVANGVGNTMETAAGRANFYAQRLMAVGFGATVAIGALAKMVGSVSETSRVFGRIQGTMGATEQQMQAIRDRASQIGAEMPVTMRETANAFEELGYSGLSAKEAIAASQDVVTLAVAGNLKMGEAAKTSARALRAYGLEADEIAQVTNAMAGAFTSSAFNMEELTKSLEYVMPVTSSAGQTITETTAALGTLADTGLAGSKAGTAMERLFTRLTRDTGRAKEAMAKLGVSIDDFKGKDGQFKNLYQIIGLLRERLSGMDDVEKMQILQQMFGQRGYRAAQKLIENYDVFLEKIGDNTRSQINDTLRTLDELSGKELKSISQTFDFKITGDSKPREVIAGLNRAAENMSQRELAMNIEANFPRIGEQSAQIFARDLKGDASVDELTESITSMTTQADIAAEQMQTLWGQIEYVRGSIDSLVHGIVRGAMPGIMAFFGVLKLVLDVMNGVPGVAEGIGVALLGLIGILTALTVEYGALYLSTKLASDATGAYVGRTVVASRVASGLRGTVNAVTAAQSRLVSMLSVANAKTAANTAMTKANAIASATLGGAKRVLSIETWRSAAATARDTASKVSNRIATSSLTASTVSGTLALWASTAAKYASATASLVAAGGCGR